MSMDRIERWASTLRTEWPFKLRFRAWPVILIALFLACIVTGGLVVATTHMTRVQYAQLQQLEQEKISCKPSGGSCYWKRGRGLLRPV